MKRYILFVLLLTFTFGLSAQKSVRKSIREGNSAYRDQRYSAAETEFAKALEENASSKEASFNLATTYYKQERWDEALKEYQHYLTLENKNAKKMSSAWSNMGNTYLKKKANEKSQAEMGGGAPAQGQQQTLDNLQMSMESYKNALRLNPSDNETRENLAIVQKMIKDQEGGGGGGADDNQDQQDKKDEQQNQDQQNQDQQDDKQDNQQNENQMSQENMQQILDAIEQQEKETQERVNRVKAGQKKEKMDQNRKHNKDW